MRWLLCALGLFLVACSGGQRSPLEVTQARVRGEIYAAYKQGLSAMELAGPYSLRARYNPTPCGAPPFEVYYLGGWHRAVLSGSDDVLEELEARALSRVGIDYLFVGTPEEYTAQPVVGGQRFVVFTLVSYSY